MVVVVANMATVVVSIVRYVLNENMGRNRAHFGGKHSLLVAFMKGDPRRHSQECEIETKKTCAHFISGWWWF